MKNFRNLKDNEFFVQNITGGWCLKHRLLDGRISAAALKHAAAIGYGGPEFIGPAAEKAEEQYREWREWREEC